MTNEQKLEDSIQYQLGALSGRLAIITENATRAHELLLKAGLYLKTVGTEEAAELVTLIEDFEASL